MDISTKSLPNDFRVYEDLDREWWNPSGPFAMLHWIADARAELIPQSITGNDLFVDLGCGPGLMTQYCKTNGYEHIGIDIGARSLQQARVYGSTPMRASVMCLPLADEIADVVCAGEILEHVDNVDQTVSEACRILRPGGTLIVDTIANTALARFVAIELGERFLGLAPRGIHDHRLFVDRARLCEVARHHGVDLMLQGMRPDIWSWLQWKRGKRSAAHMVSARTTSILFQAWGIKRTR